MPPTLQTERLLLKPVTAAVIHEVYSSKTKEEVKDFFGFDDAGYDHFLDMHEKGIENYRSALHAFLLIEKATNTPIGDCGFHSVNHKHRRGELFYILRDDAHKRKGYVSEVLPLVLQFGFETLNLNRIEALVGADNMPSVRLIQKSGFTKEGVMREDWVIDDKSYDSDCYSLLAREWREQKAAK